MTLVGCGGCGLFLGGHTDYCSWKDGWISIESRYHVERKNEYDDPLDALHALSYEYQEGYASPYRVMAPDGSVFWEINKGKDHWMNLSYYDRDSERSKAEIQRAINEYILSSKS